MCLAQGLQTLLYQHFQELANLAIRAEDLLARAGRHRGVGRRPVHDVDGHGAGEFERGVVRLRGERHDEVEIVVLQLVERMGSMAAERQAHLAEHGIDEGIALAGADAGGGDISAGQQAAGVPVGDRGLLASLGDPIILEHRFGAAMIVLLAWLGLRDARRGGEQRPLGRTLPILMIVGSLLLLGHAHSSFASTDALATLIDVQHAILGALGLLAGVVRWLELRGLFPHSVARVLWPSLVLVLGLFLAFSYREIT